MHLGTLKLNKDKVTCFDKNEEKIEYNDETDNLSDGKPRFYLLLLNSKPFTYVTKNFILQKFP